MIDNRKDSTMLIKLSLTEKSEIKRKAEALGFKSVSDYIRTTALNHTIVIKTDINMIRQIRHIGNNINQIALQLNTYSDEVIISNALTELNEFKQILQLMLNKINNNDCEVI